MTTDNFEDLITILNPDSEVEKTNAIIDSHGFSKHKDSIYKIITNIKNPQSFNLTKREDDLKTVLSNYDIGVLDSLQNALLTSYFTPNSIIESIVSPLKDYYDNASDFNPKILEPAAGSGNFIKSLNSIFNDSDITAIEKDELTFNILNKNKKHFSKPDSITSVNTPYENFPNSKTFDLIVSNVPFGNYGVIDKNLSSDYYDIYKNQIQNLFFLKAALQLNTGGVISFMTTHSLTDRNHSLKLREFLVKNLNLVSAIRLDNKTFKDSKTTVVSDVLVFQKPLQPKKILSKDELLFLESYAIERDDQEFFINSYFEKYDTKVLGEFEATTMHHGKMGLTVTPDSSINVNERISQILKEDLSKLGISKIQRSETVISNTIETFEEAEKKHNLINDAYPHLTPGNYIVLDNEIHKTEVHKNHFEFVTSTKVELNPNDKALIKDTINLRDIYKEMLVHQRNDDLPNFLSLQKKLNEEYDIYNFYYGYINLSRNHKTFRKDSDIDLLTSLELKDPKNELDYIKSDIFTIDSFNVKKVEQINTVDKAIIASFNKYAKIEPSYISDALNIPLKQWASQGLNDGLLFLNPIFNDNRDVIDVELALKTTFVSGYIDAKIKFLSKPTMSLFGELSSLVHKPLLDNSIIALLDKKPLRLPLSDINPNIGEPWIKDSIYQQFAQEHFQDDKFIIKYFPSLNSYKIKSSYSTFATNNYGISLSKNISYKKIMEYALIHNIPNFHKTIMKGNSEIKVVDKELITAIQLKIDSLNEAFSDWLANIPEHKKYVEDYYNYHFNSHVKEVFDATQFDFGIKNIEPYVHQKNGAWEMIKNNGGIIDQKVGFGKTITMSMAIAKRLELGITSKELLVGLNANFEALYDSFIEYYPDKKVLLVTPKDLKPENKNETFYKIANNNWDVVVTAHSCLNKFPISPYSSLEIYNQNLIEAEKTYTDDDLSTAQIRDLDKKIEKFKAKISNLQQVIDSKKHQNFIIFEDLKFNHITIDESHYFKNLNFTTIHSRVAGLGTQGDVKKTANLLSYIRSIQLKYKADKGVTFSTGTTISNSLSELYTLFKYITPNFLKSKGIHNFDQWARIFCRKSQAYEESVSGTIKLTERFRHFVKVPELSAWYNRITTYADDSTFKMVKPELRTHLISIEPYSEQLDYFNKIKEFGKTKNPSLLIGVSDTANMKKASGLICTNHGRKASLDMRLIDPSFQDHPKSKINVMIDNAIDIYKKFSNDKGTQLIFCDQGTPTSKTTYNLYQSIKDNLINKGIPETEITFIHSHKNLKKLFAEVNAGNIRFLIGSTQKMGVGVNVQKKIVAMHHLDFPWRPTDVEQRNGRGDRQGNDLLPKFDNLLHTFFYAKKESIDAYTFNLLQIKQQFILQIKNASAISRTLDEGVISDDGNMSYEHYMAACSSNLDFTEKLKLEKELLTYSNQFNAFQRNKYTLKSKLSFLEESTKSKVLRIDKFKKDYSKVEPLLKANKFSLKVDDVFFKKADDLGFYLQNLVDKSINGQKVGTIAKVLYNFNLSIYRKNSELPLAKDNYKIFVETPNGYKLGFNNNVIVKDKKKAGLYIFNSLERIPNIIEQQKKYLKDEKIQVEDIKTILEQPFKHIEKMEVLEKKIKDLNDKIDSKENKEDKGKDKGNNNKMKP